MLARTWTLEAIKQPLPSLIGWLAVVLLAAGFSAQLTSAVSQVCKFLGVFGLASAIPLDSLNRSRLRIKRLIRHEAASRRLERELAKLARGAVTIHEVRSILRGIVTTVSQNEKSLPNRRSVSRIRFRRRVVVRPFQGPGRETDKNSSESVVAFTQNISADGVALIHKTSIDWQTVVMTFDLTDGASLSLVVDLDLRNQRSGDRYVCGGLLRDVAASANASRHSSAETIASVEAATTSGQAGGRFS